MKFRIYIICFLATISLCSCMKPVLKTVMKQTELQVHKSPAISEKSREFKINGLQQILDNAKLVDDVQIMNVLLVHGMRSKSFDHFDPLMDEIAISLGFPKRLDKNKKPKRNGNIRETIYNVNPIHPSFYVDKDIKNEAKVNNSVCLVEYSLEGRKLRFFSVHWSPIMDSIKKQLYRIDEDQGRTKNTEHIKEQYFVELFGDQALYSAPRIALEVNNTIIETLDLMTLKDPITWIKSGSGDTKLAEKDTLSPIVFITGSLGSKIVLDVLTEEKKIPRSNDYIDKIRKEGFKDQRQESYLISKVDNLSELKQRDVSLLPKRMRYIFLLSNQLPYYAIENVSPHSLYTSSMLLDSLQMGFANYAELVKKRSGFDLQIVSFFDPNDIFGYRIPIQGKFGSINFANIRLHNTLRWTVNPIETRKFLNGIVPIPNFSGFANTILDQDYPRQEFLINLDKPNEGVVNKETAYGNLRNSQMSEILVNGDSVFYPLANKMHTATIKSTKDFERYVKFDKSPTCLKEQSRFPYLIKEPLIRIKKEIEKIYINALTRKVGRINIKPAQLPYEIIDKNLEFEGIDSHLNLSDMIGEARKPDTIHVVSIHGVRHKGPEQYAATAQMIADELEFYTIPEKDIFIEINRLNPFYKARPYTGVRIQQFRSPQGHVMRFYMMYWSNLTRPAKGWLKEIDSTSFSHFRGIPDSSLDKIDPLALDLAPRRAVLHQFVKNELIMDGFVDVLLGTDAYKEELANLVDRTFRLTFLKDPFHSEANAEAAQLECFPRKLETNQPIIITSASMGSNIIFNYLNNSHKIKTLSDSQECLKDSIKSKSGTTLYQKSILMRLQKIFFFSNQVALIRMAEITQLESLEEYKKNTLKGLDERLKQVGKKAPLEIIAFYDPEDILNYKLPQYNSHDSKLVVKTVQLNVAPGISANKKFLFRYARKADKRLRKIICNQSGGRLFSNKDLKPMRKYYKDQRRKIENTIQKHNVVLDSLKREKSSREVNLEITLIENNIEGLKREKKRLVKVCKTPLIIPHLFKIIEIGEEKGKRADQTFVFRYDIAHEGGKFDKNIISLVAHGTAKARRTDPELTFPHQFKK